ncbi:GAF domain-containing sensor histidine kinase [Fodinibius sp. AD559]|uniref:GAF domain-containing sensor histidine kinase n=1 Tax=Fodinibius sp. AD559 TaxID=3424179 RepID=UPI004046C29F
MDAPLPENEFERLIDLSELDLDYSNLEEHLEDLTKLAVRIVGTEVSLVNLIDNYTQWSVADYGLDLQQMPREDSVCQYTILADDNFEVKDLSKDQRFKAKEYVKNDPKLKYYYGIPLKTSNGVNIGALCVLDSEQKDISPEDKELLQLIARQVVRRLEALKSINELQNKVKELNQTHRKVSHDIRNPISGIIGIAQLMKDDIKNEQINEVLEYVEMIEQGGKTLLELVEEIMDDEGSQGKEKSNKNQFSCSGFCQKLNELYQPQAKSKGVELNIRTLEESDDVLFSKSKLLQIVGNLITNSIKFTEEGGEIEVEISITETDEEIKNNELKIKIEDTGVGMEQEKVEEILEGSAKSESGTGGEKGYGFGLSLVHYLVNKADGEMEIDSELGEGTTFKICLPV